MNAIVVSCCQVAPALGDPAANRELAADAISDAAAQGASVVVLPELVSSGYVFDSRADAQASAEGVHQRGAVEQLAGGCRFAEAADNDNSVVGGQPRPQGYRCAVGRRLSPRCAPWCGLR